MRWFRNKSCNRCNITTDHAKINYSGMQQKSLKYQIRGKITKFLNNQSEVKQTRSSCLIHKHLHGIKLNHPIQTYMKKKKHKLLPKIENWESIRSTPRSDLSRNNKPAIFGLVVLSHLIKWVKFRIWCHFLLVLHQQKVSVNFTKKNP